MYRSLVINPGSTSTEIAVFEDEEQKWHQVLEHSRGELDEFESVSDQLDWRRELIESELSEAGYESDDFDFIAARGGLLDPIPGGTYLIDEEMVDDLRGGKNGEHASNLAGIIAYQLAEEAGIKAYTVDPVAVDEFLPEARLSGLSELPRRCQSHALNLKGTARRCADDLDLELAEASLIGAHLGGGISIAPLPGGRIVDVNNANQGGPFSPERAGTVPALDLVEYIFQKQPDKSRIKSRLVGRGGLTAYLGTADARRVEKRIEQGEKEARIVYEAMIYQIAREIGRMSAVLAGDIDGIFITGGLAHSSYLTGKIEERVGYLGPVHIYPGSEELKNLVRGGLRVKRGEERARDYASSRLDGVRG